MPSRVRKAKFSPYSQPAYPLKPQEFLATYQIIDKHTLTEYPSDQEIRKLSDFLIQYKDQRISVDVEHYARDSYGGSYCELEGIIFTVHADDKTPNPHYEQQMIKYTEERARIKELRKQWKIDKAAWDAEQEEKKRRAELKTLAELQKKYKDEL